MAELPDRNEEFLLNGERLRVRRRTVLYGPPEVAVTLICVPVASHQQRLTKLLGLLEHKARAVAKDEGGK